MSKNFITILGVCVAILPFITIPSYIRNPLYMIFGVTIAIVGYQERHNRRKGLIGTVVRRGRKVVGPIVGVVAGSEIGGTNELNTNEPHEQTGTITN